MSDTTDVTSAATNAAGQAPAATRRRRTGTGLAALLLPELQSMAASLGISGTARMRKSELIAAITERQGGTATGGTPRPRAEVAAATAQPREEAPAGSERAGSEQRGGEATSAEPPAEPATGRRGRTSRRATRPAGAPEPRNDETASERVESAEQGMRADQAERAATEQAERNGRDRGERVQRDTDGEDETENGGGRRGRRSRYRDRRRRGERGDGGEGGREPQVSEDDVLVPVAGIVDVLENYAFIRTTGYLAGPNDVYVSMSQVKKYGLRRGDAVTGAVRANRDGEQRRDKYNPLVRLDTINGMDPEEARRRPEFYKLTPLYPQERLRLETEPHILTTRVIDLIMPVGKGQRALIVSPPKAGKTMVLQAIANAITRNNPECHLMVVLVDERPEEVTDMQRSVKGEVIAATFDRPPHDHTTVAELAIERAKRLVELGHDVVVLLDSVTRLGRSYNLAAPASGRIMSGGIDSTALYPPKRFLGAARNIENGGSLTILATALVETGSMADTVIFEEFKGTGNAELKLDRKIADRRTFPAIDIHQSGTRKEEILLAPEELAITHKLRKVLHSLDAQAALDLLLDKLKKTRTNIEFLMQIAKSTPGE
ncbi:MAG TPA: transcription termination factor Rho [Micromonosporaceae bacterium]